MVEAATVAAEEVAMEFESEKVVATVGLRTAMAVEEEKKCHIVHDLGFDSGCLRLREEEDLLVFAISTAPGSEVRARKGLAGCLRGSAAVGRWPFFMLRYAGEEENTLWGYIAKDNKNDERWKKSDAFPK